jgi:hypothetical protein
MPRLLQRHCFFTSVYLQKSTTTCLLSRLATHAAFCSTTAAGVSGGSINSDAGSYMTVDNCKFLTCTAGSAGAAIYTAGESAVTATSFLGNTGMHTNCIR